MWLLSCDGDLFGGKRLWLRPGSIHLLGRTTGRAENGEQIKYIDHKSVSRKHLTIEIGASKSGDCGKLHTRSQIKIKDGSKIGTTLNGDKFSQDTRVLSDKEYTIKLGNYEHLFHIWWYPVTLSFTGLSKKQAAKGDPLAALRERFDGTDVKLITEYVSNETTHVIAKKRNTPPALQALCRANWVLTDDFVEALATELDRSAAAEGTSTLEDDFDGNWPNPEAYILPAGSEPHRRPDSYLKPNRERGEVFEDFVFIFLSQSQYDNLLPVVTAGGGKALLWEVNSESKVEDVVQYIREVAGRKGSGQFRLSQQSGRGGIVTVRVNDGVTGSEFWKSLDLALDQRSIEQNEFLDAILTLDASGLRRQLEEKSQASLPNGDPEAPVSRQPSQTREPTQRAISVPDSPSSPSPAQRAPPSAQPEANSLRPEQQAQEVEEQSSTAGKKRNRRFITQSRFKGFDDFDPSQFSKPASQSPEPPFENHEASQAPSGQSMDVDEQGPSQSQIARKRPAPVEEAEQEDVYSTIFTAHTGFKRQKTSAAQNGQNATNPPNESGQDATKSTKAKAKRKELDVMAEVQARRKEEEEKRQQDEEYLRNALEGVDISELKNLAQVEDMPLPVRDPPPRRGNENGRSERWDPAWNGRKNFKKFRPQGQHRDGPRLQRVIVTLEEVPKKGHGMGDDYWLNSTSTTARSKSKSQSQSQSQTVRQGTTDDEDSIRFRRRIQSSREEDEEAAVAEEVLPEEIAGQPRDEDLEAAVNSTPSQTLAADSQRKAAGKRPATQQAGGPPAKKARQSRNAAPTSTRESVNLDDDDDDDALKFRRRRR